MEQLQADPIVSLAISHNAVRSLAPIEPQNAEFAASSPAKTDIGTPNGTMVPRIVNGEACAGVDVLTISRRIGHSKASMTLDVYGHLIRGGDEAAAKAIEGLLK